MAGPRETGITFVIGALDKFSAPFRALNNKLENSTRRLSLLREAWGGLQREGGRFAGLSGLAGLSSVGGNIRSQFGAATGAAAAFAAKSAAAFGVAGYAFKSQFLDTAAQFEQFEAILTTLNQGDKGKAKEQLGWISDFAARTPYELAEVTDSFVKLRAYGLDPTKGLLRVLGDTASSMGKPLESAVEAMADAVTGENERLKEFGIKAAKEGGKIIYEYTDAAGKQSKMMAKASDRAQIQATLMKIWAEKYGGGMETQSRTWNGMWSNAMDVWSRFTNMVMQDGGVLDWMKGKLGGLLEEVDRLSSDGRLQAWAKDIGEKLVTFFNAAWETMPKLWEGLQNLGSKLAWVADLLGGWDNLAVAVATLMSGLVGPVVGLAGAFIQLSAVLVATPFGWIVVAIGAVVAAITALWLKWDKIVAWARNTLPEWMVNGASAMGDWFAGQKGVFAPASASAAEGEDSPQAAPRPSLGAGETMRRVQEQRFQSLERQERHSTVTVEVRAPQGTDVRQSGAPVETDVTYMGLAAPAH